MPRFGDDEMVLPVATACSSSDANQTRRHPWADAGLVGDRSERHVAVAESMRDRPSPVRVEAELLTHPATFSLESYGRPADPELCSTRAALLEVPLVDRLSDGRGSGCGWPAACRSPERSPVADARRQHVELPTATTEQHRRSGESAARPSSRPRAPVELCTRPGTITFRSPAAAFACAIALLIPSFTYVTNG